MATTTVETVKLTIDGVQVTAPKGTLVIEAARQIMGRAEERQVEKNDLCLVNG